MRITEFYIQDYGSLRNLSIPSSGLLDPGVNVLFGPNEAGKSQIKAFIEKVLFSHRSQRSIRERPQGSIFFTHIDEEYRLESEVRRSSTVRKLISNGVVIGEDLSKLFPSMSAEVFASLYSFGLDQLLGAATTGSGTLSEHLFGAVAGGRGISISSALDRLDEKIKRLQSSDTRFDCLGLLFTSLDEYNFRIESVIAEQRAFAETYIYRDELDQDQRRIEDGIRLLGRNLEVLKRVEANREEYIRVLESKRFLELNRNCDSLCREDLRKLESLYTRSESLRRLIVENEASRQQLQVELNALYVETKLLDSSREIEALSIGSRNLGAARDRLAANLSEFEELKLRLGQAFSKFSVDFASEEILASPKEACDAEIDNLVEIRDQLGHIDRKLSSFRNLPLGDLEHDDLVSSRRTLTEKIAACRFLMENLDNSLDGSFMSSGVFRLLQILVLLAVLVSAGGSLLRIFNSALGLDVTVAAAFLLLASLLVKKGTGRSNQLFSKEAVQAAMATIGITELTGSAIRSAEIRFDEDKESIRELLEVREYLALLSRKLSPYGIAIGQSAEVSTARDEISRLVSLLKEAVKLQDLGVRVDQARLALEESKRELIQPLMGDFPELGVNGNESVDFLVALVEHLEERFAEQRRIRSHIDKLEFEITSLVTSSSAMETELHGCEDEMADLLYPLSYITEDCDEGLLELFSQVLAHRQVVENFQQFMNSFFGSTMAEAEKYFQMEPGELSQMISLEEERERDLRAKKDGIIKTKAQIEKEESDVYRVNKIQELEAERQNLLLRIEDLFGELKAAVLARELLKYANTRFEELHQPELMGLSSEIFSRITQGRYLSILKKDNDGKSDSIYARNLYGQDILDSQLSRGTREQLYMAIRLALVTRPGSLDLPLLMDDVMVNADIVRAEGLARELSLVSREHQVLYFCAKDDSIELFEAVGCPINVIDLPRLEF